MSIRDDLGSFLGIYNTHGLLRAFGQPDDNGRRIDICVEYSVGDITSLGGGRVWSPSGAMPGEEKGLRNTTGSRRFSPFSPGDFSLKPRERCLELAFAWAEQQFSISRDEFAPCPTRAGRGSYIPKIVRERALAALRDAKKRPT
jgi:hypothetical protein